MSYFDRLRSLPRDKSKAELDEHYEKMDLEKGDMLALILAGLLTFLPVLLVIGAVLLLAMKFFHAI